MTITLSGPLRSGPTTALSSEDASQRSPASSFESQRAALGWQLLRAGAAEQSVQASERAEAWIAQWLPERGHDAQAWSATIQHIQHASDRTPPLELTRQIAAAAPVGQSRLLRELASILEEDDPELFAESILNLARRNLDHHPQFALVALHAALEFSFTEGRARSLLDAAEGRGGFGAQFELQAPRLARELTSPLMLASFGSGIFFARAASLATLSRFGRLGWSSLIASESAALAVEVPAMVLTRRMGERFLNGGPALLSAEEIGNDLLSAYGPFALLRLSGNALNLGSPWLRQNLGLSGAAGLRVFSGLRFGSEVGALMLGHRLNASLGLEPGTTGSQALFQGLVGAAHMRIAGRMVEAIGLGSLGPVWEANRQNLLRRNHQEIFFGNPPGPDLAFAGLPTRFTGGREARDLLIPEPMFMVKDGKGSGSTPPSGIGRGGDAPTAPSRRALVLQLLQQNLDAYAQESENRDTFLGKLANRLQDALSKPELVQDPEFAQALAEMEAELQAVGEHGNAATRRFAQLKVLIGRGRGEGQEATREEEAVLPPELKQGIEAHVENIEADEAHRGALATSLGRMKDVFQQARQFGWNDQLHSRLVNARGAIVRLYQDSDRWKIPGLERFFRRPDPEALTQRRQGALLGLAVLNGHETATVRRLRDPNAAPSSDNHLELELLHQSIWAAARRDWRQVELDGEILSSAAHFGANDVSAATMLLTAATVRRLVEGGPKSSGLLDWLPAQDQGQYFRDRFHQLRALNTSDSAAPQALRHLSQGGEAPDYFFTGLHLFLQSQGDPARLTRGLEGARRERVPGFHPSIAVSLFGAAYGRKNLPERLWPADLSPEEYLERALKPDATK